MTKTATVWSTSFPGLVLPECGATDGLEVHHQTGRMLRIGGEADLCFECGPDGGVYHPDDADMATIQKLAAEYDAQFNKFEMHAHSSPTDASTITHSHTDGSEPHRHPSFGPSTFDSTKEEHRAYFLMGGGSIKMTPKPSGPQLDLIELTDEERTFKVVTFYRYDGAVQGEWDGKSNALFTRAQWRRSMELYVMAARNPGFDPVGHGAIPMATGRMILRFRLEPIYELWGWKPTPRTALP